MWTATLPFILAALAGQLFFSAPFLPQALLAALYLAAAAASLRAPRLTAALYGRTFLLLLPGACLLAGVFSLGAIFPGRFPGGFLLNALFIAAGCLLLLEGYRRLWRLPPPRRPWPMAGLAFLAALAVGAVSGSLKPLLSNPMALDHTILGMYALMNGGYLLIEKAFALLDHLLLYLVSLCWLASFSAGGGPAGKNRGSDQTP